MTLPDPRQRRIEIHARVEQELATTGRLRILDDSSYRGFMHRCSQYPRFSPAFELAQRWGRLIQQRLADKPELKAELKRRAILHATTVITAHDILHPRPPSRIHTHPQYALPDIAKRIVVRDQLRYLVLEAAAHANIGPDGRETLGQHDLIQAATFLGAFWKHGKGLVEVIDEYNAISRQKHSRSGLLKIPRLGVLEDLPRPMVA